MNYIFDRLMEDFDKNWDLNHSKDGDAEWKEKKRNWLLEWAEKYSTLFHQIIPATADLGSFEEYQKARAEKHAIVWCLVETAQEYNEFNFKDISNVLEKLGELANFMYCARRDYLDGLLEKYYVRALEQIMWMVATFIQKPPYNSGFTDLVTRLNQVASLANQTIKEVKEQDAKMS
jgi:hypothetical protein